MKREIIFKHTDEQTTERITIERCEDKFFIEICDECRGLGTIYLNEEQIWKLANSTSLYLISKYFDEVRGMNNEKNV